MENEKLLRTVKAKLSKMQQEEAALKGQLAGLQVHQKLAEEVQTNLGELEKYYQTRLADVRNSLNSATALAS